MTMRDIRQQARQAGIVTRHLEAWRLKHERENKRQPDGYWHPSSISGCPTAAVYEYLGFVLPGAPFDARLLRIFDTGHAVHHMLQNQSIKAGIVPQISWPETVTDKQGVILRKQGDVCYAIEVPIKDEQHRLKGTLDIIFDITGLRFTGEVKSKHSSSFAKMTDAQEDHKIQAISYHWKALDNGWVNTDYAVCLYFSKDDAHIAEYKVPVTEKRITEIKEKLDLMNAMVDVFVKDKRFPEPYYKEPQKPPCRTCRWAQGCHATLQREAWITKMTEAKHEPPTQAPEAPAAEAAQPSRKPPVRIRK